MKFVLISFFSVGFLLILSSGDLRAANCDGGVCGCTGLKECSQMASSGNTCQSGTVQCIDSRDSGGVIKCQCKAQAMEGGAENQVSPAGVQTIEGTDSTYDGRRKHMSGAPTVEGTPTLQQK